MGGGDADDARYAWSLGDYQERLATDPDSLGHPADIGAWPPERRAKCLVDCSGYAAALVAESDLLVGKDSLNGVKFMPLADIGKDWNQPRLTNDETESMKVRVAAIRPDAEVGPVMQLLDGVLSSIDLAQPPMRDVEGWPVQVQCRETAGLHELTAEGANDEDDEKSRLPPPKHFRSTKHDKESLEVLIGDHVTFIKETKDGECAVAPPAKFVARYLKYRRSKLPRVHAVLTMPLYCLAAPCLPPMALIDCAARCLGLTKLFCRFSPKQKTARTALSMRPSRS